MEVAWSQLREEAHRLAQDIGQSGREHHSLANSRAVWDAIRAHGVPPEHREWVWPILLHDQSMKLQRQHTESGASYSQLLHGMAEDLQETETSSSLEQAQEEAMERFHHLNPFQERKIRRILLAYAKSKDAFYYCHGMVESCVVLSTFLVEEDAFWSFRMLLEVLLPKYFDESVVDFHTDCLVLQELLRVHDPALSEHFALLGVSIQLLCTKWFFSFFAESMPFEVVCRLYDIMFVDICSRQLGSKIVFSTSLSVLLYLSSTLVEIQDVNVVLDVINEFCWTTLNEYSVAESFLDLINFMHEQINDEELAALRQKYRAQLAQEEEHRKTMQRKIQTKKSSKKLKLEKQGSAEQQDHPRKGRINSIKLLIQWRKHMVDNSDACSSQERKMNSSRVSNSDSSEKNRCGRNSRTRSREQENSSSSSDEESRSDNGEAGLEIVTTPSEKEMLARVYQGISKINRRRSRTSSSMRSFSLRGADGALNSLSSRSLSLSNSILSTTSSTKEGDDVSQAGEGDPEDEDALWERLRVAGAPKSVVRHSLSGVPDAHRSWIWPVLINQLPAPPDLPRNLAAVKNDDEEALLDREIAKSIENDITRTRNLRNDQVVPMRRVLTAFANRNRRVGYCQGMNEILVVLLQYLDEDQALCALTLLIEVLLPAYHVDSMIGLHTDCAVMNTLLRQNDAELHAHLNELGLNMEILCTKWLVTCFLTSLPIFCGLKVIDMLLARSKEKQRASRVLLGVGISIFFTLRETLLDAKDAGEVLLAINDYFAREMTKTTVEMDKFLHFCLIITDQLEPDIVEEFRLVHKDEVMERFAAFEAKKIEMRQQLEEAKAKQRKVASAPPSPSKTERLSTLSASSIMSGKSNGNNRISGLSSYISNPLRSSGGSKTTTTGAGDDKESHKRYQRVDVLQAHHSFSEDLVKMEDQLEDLADLFLRGKIDEKEHSCIRAQIVRKWCKGMNSPQSAMVRVQCVKHTYCERSGEGFTNSAPGLLEGPVRSSFTGEAEGAHRGRKGSISLYGRMKKAQKSALAIFKSTFE
ncbi:hypothetical protein PC129_g20789 [Phytophthora cactorum]|uniref:Rab-GAP TBC domain-containing protein n=3 Tax=Phytophthora cactorum TaxID=29920 RepID=A0A329S0S1_9STRA|nr:hypothetical protein Pcac1_g24790 [Phytophthora cactorum]KAG2797888.1 hypothetical protein PC111_g21093 [Phytophthora cactorum]KAG2797981.1 hypothetical protein PC112_g21552 [Phytophthora cactorum]KAG2828294.1 hypothetical protein PC113_g21494 [Phytophthora cactorum]KAG2877110.1 hypothetical protein PC114_g23832 [Phytophthora cactorum]